MTPSTMAGLMAKGPLPAGMLRIRQGSQERYVWPVHLPGWLAMGWRVAGAEAPSVGIDTADPPAPIAAAAADLLDQDDAKPASSRGRRGRRRKEEPLPAAHADTRISTVGDASENDGTEEPDPEPETAAEVPGLTDLPDDLFDDPLI
jgi:hypothetical protein